MTVGRGFVRAYGLLVLCLLMTVFEVATCAGQCASRKEFGPYSPASGSTPTLSNPLPGASHGATLKIVTMGDSVVWGNGNLEANKFTVKVAHYIADATGRSVTLVAYAHSGARLSRIDDPTSVVPVDGGVPQPDLNSQAPSTTEQEACAVTARDQDAEIVILDGCINEVGAKDIALPFPLNWTGKKTIKRHAFTACSDPMKGLLANVYRDFEKATIVVLGYYQIVTADSQVFAQRALPGSPPGTAGKGSTKEAVNELDAERAKLLSMTSVGKAQLQSKSNNLALGIQPWRKNSKAFLDMSTGCLRWAVSSSNGTTVPPLSKGYKACVKMGKVPTQQATPTVRAFMVELENRPEFGYGAPGATHQWRLHPLIPPTVNDDLFAERSQICDRVFHGDVFKSEECRINAMAHPNHPGTDAYADGVDAVLRSAWGAGH